MNEPSRLPKNKFSQEASYNNMKHFIPIAIIFFLFPWTMRAEEILTWEACVNEAKMNHPYLISAKEKLNQAKALKWESISPVLPQIGSDFNMGVSKSSSQDKINNYSYGINGKQLLFDGLKSVYDIKASLKNIKSVQYNYETVSATIRSTLRKTFIQLLKTQELLSITQDIAERRKKNLELVRISYNAGREHRGSLLTAEANLAQAQLEVAEAKRNIELSQRQLLKELGRDRFSPIEAKGDLQIFSTNKQEPAFEEIASQNPSLLEILAQKEAARLNLSSAKASFFPQVNANGSYDRHSPTWPPNESQWTIGLSLSFPLFQGGRRLAEISRTKSVLAQVQSDEKSLKQNIIVNLQQNWINFQNALDASIVQEKFLEATDERAKIAQAQYSIGLLSFDNWTIIEDNLANIKKSYLESQANTLISEANWILSQGGTLDEK